MPGKYRKDGPAAGPDAASLDTWAAWAGLGAPVEAYPARRGAHRELSRWERFLGRLSAMTVRRALR
jgi:hypothetical protein